MVEQSKLKRSLIGLGAGALIFCAAYTGISLGIKNQNKKEVAIVAQQNGISTELASEYLDKGVDSWYIDNLVEHNVTPSMYSEIKEEMKLNELVDKEWVFDGKEYMEWKSHKRSLSDMVVLKDKRLGLEDVIAIDPDSNKTAEQILEKYASDLGVSRSAFDRYIENEIYGEDIQVLSSLGEENSFKVLEDNGAETVVSLIKEGKLNKEIYEKWDLADVNCSDMIASIRYGYSIDKAKKWTDAGVSIHDIDEIERENISADYMKKGHEAGYDTVELFNFARMYNQIKDKQLLETLK
jgi:hypothetical protein